MQAVKFAVGSQVAIEGPLARVAEVIETRPGHCKCSLQDGRAVWIPVDRLKLVASATAAPRPQDGNRYQAPAVEASAASTPGSPGTALSAAGKPSFPLGWIIIAGLVTSTNVLVDTFVPHLAFKPGSPLLAPLLFFGLIAIRKSCRNVRTAARVFTVVGGIALANVFLNVLDGSSDLGNPPELNAQIQERMNELASEGRSEDDTASAAEARRLAALEWAASASRGKDARLFAALVELQKLNVELARKLDEATAALDATSAPPGLARVDSRKALAQQAGLLKQHAEVLAAGLTHFEQAPTEHEKVLRGHGLDDGVIKQHAAAMEKALPARIAHYEQAAQLDAVHTHLFTLLDREWGRWTYDAAERSVSFESNGALAEYNGFVRKLRHVAGVEDSAGDSDEASDPTSRGSESREDPHNPSFRQQVQDNEARALRAEQDRQRSAARNGDEMTRRLKNWDDQTRPRR